MFEEYPDIVSAEAVKEMLGIGKNAAYHLLMIGEIECFRHNRIWKIPKNSVIEYIRNKTYQIKNKP